MAAPAKTWIIQFWSWIFGALKWVSPFRWVRAAFPNLRGNYRFVEAWVLGDLLLSAACLAALSSPGFCWWQILILCYGAIRIFEIVVYQTNVLLFDEYSVKKGGETYGVAGLRRLVLLLLHNYIEVLFWFSVFYRNSNHMFDSGRISLDSFAGSLYFSIVTMSTLGYGDVTPTQDTALFLVMVQTMIGVFMALVMLARFVSLLPKPGTLDLLEKDDPGART
jgi:hypothetical protein